MRTRQQQYLYQKLELLESATANSNFLWHKALRLIQRVWTHVHPILFAREELQFWEISDRNGQIYWKVYDPTTCQIFYLDSLQSVLEWIEERHYRSS